MGTSLIIYKHRDEGEMGQLEKYRDLVGTEN